jgi:hypothetical protein
MSDADAIYDEVVAGLVDNSRINQVPYSDGWDPDLALDTYYRDPDMGRNAELQARYGTPTDAETAALLARISAWMEEHAGRSWSGDYEDA